MTKFEKIKKALEEKTRDSGNFITLTTNVDARHNGKYTTWNVITNNTNWKSYKTLNEVIEEYGLEI